MKVIQASARSAGRRLKRLSIALFFSFYVLWISLFCENYFKSTKVNELAISFIEFYQTVFSNNIPFVRCRYKITCSHYSKDVIHKYGLKKGIVLTAKRLNSCM